MKHRGFFTSSSAPSLGIRWLACLAFALGWALGPSAVATRMQPLSLEQLTAHASVVVRGRVESVESARDEAGRIFTRVGLRRLELWKGRLDVETFEIVAGGGVLGDREVRVVGQATYRVGEEIVAYLVRNPAGEFVTVGLSQGRFLVWRDPLTGQARVGSGSVGEPASAGTRKGSHSGPKAPMSLDELKQQTLRASQ